MRKTILWLAVTGLMLMASTGRAWAYSESDSDTWLGVNAAANLPAGNFWDTFIGADAGRNNTTGGGNSFIGAEAGYSNTTGAHNSFIGVAAGYHNTSGDGNSFLGAEAGWSNTTGYSNSFVGYRGGYYNSTGAENSFIGAQAELQQHHRVREYFHRDKRRT